MALDVVIVPCLADNFAYLLRCPATGTVALVDAPEAAPVQAALDARGWRLDLILLTHHHDDHTQAVPALRSPGVQVWGAQADAHRLPPLDRALAPGAAFTLGAERGHALDVPGHTLGHLAFHFPDSAALFSADSLMAAGCGRLFEGTADQMWTSLSRLALLPDETMVYSGHDYLRGNLAFAQSLEPGNAALISRMARVADLRQTGAVPMPWSLAEEKATNPFLRAHLPELKAAVGMAHATHSAAFAEIRARKDRF